MQNRPNFLAGKAKGWPNWLAGLLLGLAVAGVYGPSIGYGLVFLDDPDYVVQNTDVNQGLTWGGVGRAFVPGNTASAVYAPLLWISYMADTTLFGAGPRNPWGYHLTNVFLHAGTAVLLFALLRLLGGDTWGAFLLAALWALHPLRVESVAWVTERKDVLSGFWGMASVLAWLKAWGKGGGGRVRRCACAAVSVGSFGLALLAKPSLVPLPVLLLLLDWWPLGRLSGRRGWAGGGLRCVLEKLPFAVAALGASLGAVARQGAVAGDVAIPLAVRLMSVGPHYVFYLWKTVWPTRLSVMYPMRWSFPAWEVGVAVVLLGAVCWGAWRGARRWPEVLAGWGWFVLFLLPVCGIIALPSSTVEDRYTYFAAMGVSVGLLAAWRRWRGGWRRNVAVVAGTACLAGCVALTSFQLPHWRNGKTLAEQVLRVSPLDVMANSYLLSTAILERGDFAGAGERLDRLMETTPGRWGYECLKATILSETDGPEAAWAYLAGQEAPTDLMMRGQWLSEQAELALACGKLEEAMRIGREVFDLMPAGGTRRVVVASLLMTTAFEMGDKATALAYGRMLPGYERKERIELLDTLPYAIFEWSQGRRKDAGRRFRAYVEAYEGNVGVLNNLTWTLATADWSPIDPQEVLGWAERLCKLCEGNLHPGILDTLAAAQANAGDFAGASATMERALGMFPDGVGGDLAALRTRMEERKATYDEGNVWHEDAFSRMYSVFWGGMGRVQ